MTEAERTGRGIALEDLTGIRARVRLRKPQRVTLHSWAFAQLGQYVADKAVLAGVPVVYVDPAYTYLAFPGRRTTETAADPACAARLRGPPEDHSVRRGRH